MALTRLFIHDTFFDATDNFTYTPGMRLTLDNTTQSARIARLQASGVVSTDETLDQAGVAITGGTIDGTVIGGTTPAAGDFTTLAATGAAITGGTIDGTVIGGTTPAAGDFTTLATSGIFTLPVDTWHKSSDGHERLYYGANTHTYYATGNTAGLHHFRTTESGQNVVTLDSSNARVIFDHNGDSDTYIQRSAANTVQIVTGGVVAYSVNGSQDTTLGAGDLTVSNGNITVNGRVFVGDGSPETGNHGYFVSSAPGATSAQHINIVAEGQSAWSIGTGHNDGVNFCIGQAKTDNSLFTVASSFFSISSSGDTTFQNGDVTVATGNINAPSLPTSDPSVVGRFWNDSGAVKVSI